MHESNIHIGKSDFSFWSILKLPSSSGRTNFGMKRFSSPSTIFSDFCKCSPDHGACSPKGYGLNAIVVQTPNVFEHNCTFDPKSHRQGLRQSGDLRLRKHIIQPSQRAPQQLDPMTAAKATVIAVLRGVAVGLQRLAQRRPKDCLVGQDAWKRRLEKRFDQIFRICRVGLPAENWAKRLNNNGLNHDRLRREISVSGRSRNASSFSHFTNRWRATLLHHLTGCLDHQAERSRPRPFVDNVWVGEFFSWYCHPIMVLQSQNKIKVLQSTRQTECLGTRRIA